MKPDNCSLSSSAYMSSEANDWQEWERVSPSHFWSYGIKRPVYFQLQKKNSCIFTAASGLGFWRLLSVRMYQYLLSYSKNRHDLPEKSQQHAEKLCLKSGGKRAVSLGWNPTHKPAEQTHVLLILTLRLFQLNVTVLFPVSSDATCFPALGIDSALSG